MKQEIELIKACTRALLNANGDLQKAAIRIKPMLENFTIAYYDTIDSAKKVKKVNVDSLFLILKTVADEFGVTIEQLQSSSRIREVVIARDVYIYLAVIDFGFQPTIVTRRVNRTHCTSSPAIKKCIDTNFKYDDNERKYKACHQIIREALQIDTVAQVDIDGDGHVLPGSGHEVQVQQLSTN